LLQLFGLTDLGYRQMVAERDLFASPQTRASYAVVSQWCFDPGYSERDRAGTEPVIEPVLGRWFSQTYPRLSAHLAAHPAQKTTVTVEGAQVSGFGSTRGAGFLSVLLG
jgi:hypothetical protein